MQLGDLPMQGSGPTAQPRRLASELADGTGEDGADKPRRRDDLMDMGDVRLARGLTLRCG